MLDKETYTREEVEELIHKARCDMLIEETIRLDKTLKWQEAYKNILPAIKAIRPAGTAKGA